MSESSEQIDSEAQEAATPRPEAFHILVVDDEEDIREVLCELIETEGYRVTGAPGGLEALEVLEKTSVDLVITDLMMPEMTGWQLIDALKERDSGILVVVITGYMSEQGEAVLTNRHVDGYLVKPFDHHRLQILLNALLFSRNLGRTAKVVAVDDDPDTTEAIEHILSKRGLYVTTFQEPDEALHHIRKTPPDLVIVDLMFPGADGFDLCQAIRADPDTALMPIVILTAHPSRENVARAVQLGINGFVAKPFDANELGERALKMIRQSGKTPPG